MVSQQSQQHTHYGLGSPWFNSKQGQEIFSSPKPSSPPLAPTQPPIQWVLGFFWAVRWKQLRHEVHQSPPSSAEVKKEWSCTSPPTVYLHDTDRGNSTIFVMKSV
jgi:hypothetical protein